MSIPSSIPLAHSTPASAPRKWRSGSDPLVPFVSFATTNIVAEVARNEPAIQPATA